jgi:cell division protein FtsB
MVLAVALLLVGLFLYAAAQTAAQSYRLHDDRRTLTYEVEALRRQRAELRGLREYLASDEYIEAMARTQFGLVRPGETAVLVDAPGSARPERRPGQRWWEALFAR